jgi:hypothetical protein
MSMMDGMPPPDAMGLPGVDQVMDANPMGPRQDAIPRDRPDVTSQRKALISAWSRRVKSAKGHWKKPFDRMIEDQQFAYGKQWSKNQDDRRYVANLTLRLVSQKTAFLYAKNPKAVARKRERINNTSWDGKQSTLDALMKSGAMMMQQMPGLMPGGMPPGGVGPPGMLPGGLPPGGGPPGTPPGGPSPPPGVMGAVTEGVLGAMGPMLGTGGGLPGAGGAQLPAGFPGQGPPAGIPGLPPGGDLPAAMGALGQQMGMPINPMMATAVSSGIDIATDAARVKRENEMLDKLGRTLELLYAYQVNEQVHPFKSMMKKMVRRTVTTGVGYVKLGFERVMQLRPDMEKGIADASERLATLERLAADAADNITDENDKEAEQLRLLIQDMAQATEMVAREGLVFDYPLSTSIIPDVKCIDLKHFLGTDWVAEEFILSTNEIEEIYGVDVRNHSTEYSRSDIRGPDPVAMAREWSSGEYGDGRGSWGDADEAFACVWEIYSRKDGLVYVICDGYDDFLRDPASPEIYNERFYPWYALVFNECENEHELFPPSDVRLIRDQQMEYNRCREALKEHRIAARPFIGVVGGSLEEEELEKLSNRQANAIVELNALQPNQDIKQLLQAFAGAGIDPNLYEVNPVYEDILRTTGIQEANLGGTSDATATQSQIAEGSRQTSMGSNIDDLNDLLTNLARNGGQILMREMSLPSVQKIVGIGAVWPELSREEIANEVLLEIEAGSMGRPNQAQEIAAAQRLMPLLIQLPGINPEFLAKELIRRLDDRLDMTQAFMSQMPSIVAMNGMAQGAVPGAGAPAGAGQGPQGAANGEKPGAPSPGGPPDQTEQLTGAPPGGAAAAPTLQ